MDAVGATSLKAFSGSTELIEGFETIDAARSIIVLVTEWNLAS